MRLGAGDGRARPGAFDVAVVDGQINLAASARISVSSVREDNQGRWGSQCLFDNLGSTAWEPDPAEPLSSLEVDLASPRLLGAVSLAQAAAHQGWTSAFEYELKVRDDGDHPWKTVLKSAGTLGGPPILAFEPVRARLVRLELTRTRKDAPVQLAEFRLFAPID